VRIVARARKITALVGPVAFYVGLLIALGAAFVSPSGVLYLALGIIGVIVGILNITAAETGPFLFASIAFVVSALAMANLIGTLLPGAETTFPEIFRLATNLVVLIGAGAMVISLRAIYELAKAR
jgi:hypothetical protein